LWPRFTEQWHREVRLSVREVKHKLKEFRPSLWELLQK
jgi:hypothetical protein